MSALKAMVLANKSNTEQRYNFNMSKNNITITETNYRVRVTRNGLTRSRRFNYDKFGGYRQAYNTALKYVEYLKSCTLEQFNKALRPVGRPLKSEFFGTNKFNAA